MKKLSSYERAVRKAVRELGDWKAQARNVARSLRQAVRASSAEESANHLDEANGCMYQLLEVFWDLKECSAESKYLDPNYRPDPEDDVPVTSQIHLPEKAWHRLYIQAKRDGIDIHTALARLILPEEAYVPPEFPKLDFGGGPVN